MVAVRAEIDWDLTAAVLAGDRAAAEGFCRRYESTITKCLESRWRSSPLSAFIADATQEALLECLRSGGALANLDRARCPSLDAYVRGVVRNIAARVERRECIYAARCRDVYAGVTAQVATEPGLPDWSESDSVTEAIHSAVANLDALPATAGHSLGELVRLHFGEGQPVRRIAARWCEPASRVHELRRKACRMLRRLLVTYRNAAI